MRDWIPIGLLLILRLGQRQEEGIAQDRPVGKADLGDGAHRVDAFGRRESHPRAPRRTKEAMQVLSHPCLSEDVLTRGLGDEGGDLRHGGLDVRLVFQEDVQRILDHLVAKLGSLQQHQHARPVDGLAD
jgi:hypothetical protein